MAVHALTYVPQFLRDYFYAGGEGPISLEALQNQKYRDILSIRLYYDWHTWVYMRLPSIMSHVAHPVSMIYSPATRLWRSACG